MATPTKRASTSNPERSVKSVKPVKPVIPVIPVKAVKAVKPIKALTPVKPVKPVKPSVAAAAAADAEPFLRFHHTVALRKKTLSLLGTLEQANDATVHRDALSALVVELTNSGLDAFFMTPFRRAGAGFIAEQSAKLGMVGVQQVMGSVVRQIVGRMDGPQLISVSVSIRQFMR
jgi:hypothetical protein